MTVQELIDENAELSAALVRSLFCGLPNRERRMAVFVSASDETAGPDTNGIYTYGGLIAKERYWDRVFAREWDRRVLAGPPRIQFLHMTEIRSPKWREQHGIDKAEGERRVFQAIEVLDKAKHVYPITIEANGADFQGKVASVAKQYGISKLAKHKAAVSAITRPDCLCFLYYAMHVLAYVRAKHPDAERVDFVVERNDRITDHLEHYYNILPEILSDPDILADGSVPNLAPLMGTFIPGEKDRVPLQAADVFCWHKQRFDHGLATGDDLQAYEPAQFP